jgi:hypothetical protein
MPWTCVRPGAAAVPVQRLAAGRGVRAVQCKQTGKSCADSIQPQHTALDAQSCSWNPPRLPDKGVGDSLCGCISCAEATASMATRASAMQAV